MKQKSKMTIIAKMLLLLLTLVLPWTIPERVLADTGYGSISINLKDLESPKAEVKFKAYKVGTWNSTTEKIELAENLKDIGISLDALVYASDWDEAALKLSKQTEALETLSSINGMTDQNGTLTFSDIELGMYLIVQDGQSEYGIVSPFLAAIPYLEDGSLKSELTIQPKAEPPLATGDGRIEVTMRIGKLEQRALEIADIMLMDEVTFYVGIFRDAKGQIPYGTDYIREISMKGIRKGKAVFENLPDGTYYIFVTDKDGNAYPINEKQMEQEDVWLYRLNHETESHKVTIDGKADSPIVKMGFLKQYYELNKNYCYAGTIYISKQVKQSEQEIDVSEIFYAGLFLEKGGKNLWRVVTLENNGTVEIDVPLDSVDGTEEYTYYVYETDKDGNLIDKDTFGYSVSGEGKVEWQNDNWEANVCLVNDKKMSVTETPTPTPTEVPVAPTETPTPIPTEVPVAPTEAPVEPTETPAPTEAPIEPTETPAPTEAPVEPTEKPAPTEVPAEPTETPAPTEAPIKPTETPTPTQTVEPTITPTKMPIEPTVTPTDDNTDTTNAVRTGDDTPIVKYSVLMVMAVLLLIVGMVYWRGHKKYE